MSAGIVRCPVCLRRVRVTSTEEMALIAHRIDGCDLELLAEPARKPRPIPAAPAAPRVRKRRPPKPPGPTCALCHGPMPAEPPGRPGAKRIYCKPLCATLARNVAERAKRGQR